MKKLITLVLILTVAFTSTKATEAFPVSENIKRAFSKEFTSANQVSWSFVSDRDVYKASFLFDGKELNAYFTKEGEFVGTSRYISRNQMPVVVTQQLEKEYSNYVVRTIIEYASKDQTYYFITIEGKKALMIKATPSGDLSYFKKIRKS
jgi:hypothetical protein